MIAAVGDRVLFYDGFSGELLNSLRGHEKLVTSVSYSYDGQHFASGGADRVVVIWKASGQGKLKYNHSAPIQRVKYSPTSFALASCSDSDFGIWSPDRKQVQKEKMNAKILDAAWSSDGTLLALSTFEGFVSVRDRSNNELYKINRGGPCWCISFIQVIGVGKTLGQDSELLAIGSWDKTISFHKLLADKQTKQQTEKQLKFLPVSLSTAGVENSKNQYLILSGSNKKTSIFSKDGIELSELLLRDSWVMCNDNLLEINKVVTGTYDGKIEVSDVTIMPIHTFHQEKYAYRENLTDIVIHHLVTDRKVRIKCKDIIRGICLYKNKLAVQLNDKVCVYESSAEDAADMHFRARKERMSITSTKSDLMVVTYENIIFCANNIIELYAFNGQRIRVWRMDATVNYLKVDGGLNGREGLLVGLTNGSIEKIYIDNPFPIHLGNRNSKIMFLENNLYRQTLASVDNDQNLEIMDISTQKILYQASNVVSVAFNEDVSDMFTYTTTDEECLVVSGISVGVNMNSIDPQKIPYSGPILACKGQRIFCLSKDGLDKVDIAMSIFITKALRTNDFEGAYAMACLGATENDWRKLAVLSLRSNQISIAKRCFERLKDYKMLYFIESYDLKDSSNTTLDVTIEAELLAYQGRFREAAKCYAKAGRIEDALRLYEDMKMFDEAKSFSQGIGMDNTKDLTEKHANWLKEGNDWRGASKLYVSMHKPYDAAKIIIDAKAEGVWQDALIELVRSISSDNKDALIVSGQCFSDNDEYAYAKECFEKADENSKLLNLYAKKHMWNDAVQLMDETGATFEGPAMLPFAEWLIGQDKYEDAMTAFKGAGRTDLARKVLHDLTSNAIRESRFKDAAYFLYMLSKESEGEERGLQAECERKADLYYAYAAVHEYVTSPFTSHQPETLFQTSRFILNSLGGNQDEDTPFGISKMGAMYTLARQAMTLGAYKLARYSYDMLGRMKLPKKKTYEVQLDMLKIQAKPIVDNPDHISVCYRCSNTNPFLNPFNNKNAKGDVCITCGHPFVRSFITFDVLPMVEFVPEPSISDDRAIELIRQDASTPLNRGRHNGERETHDAGVNMLQFDDFPYDSKSGDSKMGEGGDLFHKCVNRVLDEQVSFLVIILLPSVLTHNYHHSGYQPNILHIHIHLHCLLLSIAKRILHRCDGGCRYTFVDATL